LGKRGNGVTGSEGKCLKDVGEWGQGQGGKRVGDGGKGPGKGKKGTKEREKMPGKGGKSIRGSWKKGQ
jgi:hypothetical protein